MASRNGTVSTGVARRSEVAYRGTYASLYGALGTDDVELLSAKKNSAYRRVVLRVACVSVSVTFATR